MLAKDEILAAGLTGLKTESDMIRVLTLTAFPVSHVTRWLMVCARAFLRAAPAGLFHPAASHQGQRPGQGKAQGSCSLPGRTDFI